MILEPLGLAMFGCLATLFLPMFGNETDRALVVNLQTRARTLGMSVYEMAGRHDGQPTPALRIVGGDAEVVPASEIESLP